MEQRPLRLGDIVDDYCPRERRITNHAIVAIVEDAIRQTRCATCDTEHVYKQGKEPLRRRKDAPAPALVEDGGAPLAPDPDTAALVDPPTPADQPMAADAALSASESAAEPAETPRQDDHWPAHRQLIRASLPKIEGDVPAPRPIPEFTMYQRPAGRGGQGFRFRHGRQGNGDGNVAGRGDFNGRGYGNGNPNGNVNGNGDGNRAGQGRSRRRRSHGKRSG